MCEFLNLLVEVGGRRRETVTILRKFIGQPFWYHSIQFHFEQLWVSSISLLAQFPLILSALSLMFLSLTLFSLFFYCSFCSLASLFRFYVLSSSFVCLFVCTFSTWSKCEKCQLWHNKRQNKEIFALYFSLSLSLCIYSATHLKPHLYLNRIINI